jgi:hypothetical protein
MNGFGLASRSIVKHRAVGANCPAMHSRKRLRIDNLQALLVGNRIIYRSDELSKPTRHWNGYWSRAVVGLVVSLSIGVSIPSFHMVKDFAPPMALGWMPHLAPSQRFYPMNLVDPRVPKSKCAASQPVVTPFMFNLCAASSTSTPNFSSANSSNPFDSFDTKSASTSSSAATEKTKD